MEIVEIAQIAVSAARYDIDIPYSYLIPAALSGQVKPGVRVTVPSDGGGSPEVYELDTPNLLKYMLKDYREFYESHRHLL